MPKEFQPVKYRAARQVSFRLGQALDERVELVACDFLKWSIRKSQEFDAEEIHVVVASQTLGLGFHCPAVLSLDHRRFSSQATW